MVLTERHKRCIQLMILMRFDKRGQLKAVAERVGVTAASIQDWRKDPAFRAEYKRQLEIYKNNFNDIKLADRKERVKALSELYEEIDEAAKTWHGDGGGMDVRSRTAEARLRILVLDQIRGEILDTQPDQMEFHHLHQLVGVNAPPRATSYEEWVTQNKAMEVQQPPAHVLALPEVREALEAESEDDDDDDAAG